MEPWKVASWDFLGSDMYSEFCNNKPVVGSKELGTAVSPAVLKDPPTSTNEDVIDLLSHAASIAIPSQAARLSSLEPGAPNSQSSGLCKVQKKRAVDILGAR